MKKEKPRLESGFWATIAQGPRLQKRPLGKKPRMVSDQRAPIAQGGNCHSLQNRQWSVTRGLQLPTVRGSIPASRMRYSFDYDLVNRQIIVCEEHSLTSLRGKKLIYDNYRRRMGNGRIFTWIMIFNRI